MRDLRKIGVSVFHIHTVRGGFGDIICGWRGKNYIFEIKDPDQPPSKRVLTEDEEKFHDSWKGQVSVIKTTEDALKIMEIVK